jgi:pentose-5-phosphate-3-epimerase
VELYREIAATREWIRKPKIQLALVFNPAVPLSITLPLIKYLGMRDLRKVMMDRSLAEAVRTSARKLLQEKRGG